MPSRPHLPGERDAGTFPKTERNELDTEPTAAVYLARHGQTPLNVAGLLRGRMDPVLDEVGERQAEVLGDALGARSPEAVLASPLRRAVQTAEPIARRAGVGLETDERLIDRDYGRWAGSSRRSVERKFGTLDSAPGVEAETLVRSRAWDALIDLRSRVRGEVVLVTHDAVLRAVLAWLLPDLEESEIDVPTGSFTTLDWRSGSWSVVAVGEVPTPRSHPSSSHDRGFGSAS
jgi:broad specificity phosphatase PhoE